MKNLTDCKNLGKTILNNLKLVGVKNLEDLQKVGPVEVYKRLIQNYPEKIWPVCYYLYSIEGALINKHWNDIGEKRKSDLLKAVGKKL